MARVRWIVAGQLGDAFDDGGRMLIIESRRAFARQPMHRRKAHLYLSALRHRVAELGDRAEYHRADTYIEILRGRDDLEMIDPTSYQARRFARRLGVEILPSRGFVTSEGEFAEWVAGRKRLLMEDYYEWVRDRTGILMDGQRPAGGHWNYDRSNREPPPKSPTLGLPDPWWPQEDDIDAEVRDDLDRWQRDGDVRFVGDDGPREFAVTPDEARKALAAFVQIRLGDFGPFEDAMLTADWTMSHSLLSVPMNLGVLHPREPIEAVVAEYRAGRAPLSSVEGYVRQILGWREWMWHLYWHFGEDYITSNHLDARGSLPPEFTTLDGAAIEAACLSHAIGTLREHGWTHHIQRLMVIGNHALQRGYDPHELSDWYAQMYVDGTPWVMPPNVVGMSQYADGGQVATKPYTSGGAYIDRMSDYCGRCRFDPKKRLGEDACPYTAGYWAFLDRNEKRLGDNRRMQQPLAGLRRLTDRDEVVEQERTRDGL